MSRLILLIVMFFSANVNINDRPGAIKKFLMNF